MPLYETTVTTHGGREGHAESNDGLLKVNLALPKEMGGKGGATNPEMLFAAGYGACFESALALVARNAKVRLTDPKIAATVAIDKLEDGFKLSVKLQVSAGGADKPTLEKLMHEAHKVCPYSKATRGNIDVQLSVA